MDKGALSLEGDIKPIVVSITFGLEEVEGFSATDDEDDDDDAGVVEERGLNKLIFDNNLSRYGLFCALLLLLLLFSIIPLSDDESDNGGADFTVGVERFNE